MESIRKLLTFLLRQGDKKLVWKEGVEEIMSVRGRHVEMPKEHVILGKIGFNAVFFLLPESF